MGKTTLPVLDLTGDKDLSEKQSFSSREFWSPTTVSLNQAGHVPRFNEVKYSYSEVKCRRHKHRLREPIENLAKSDKLDKHDVKMAVKNSHDSNASVWRDNGSNASAWRDNGSNTDSNTDFKTTVLKKRKSRRTFELAPTGETREIATLLISNNHVQDTSTKKVHTAKDTDPGGVNHRDDGQDTTPFQTKTFMSSSMMKKISIPRRYHDSFGGPEYSMTAQRGVPLHTPRYLCDGPVYQESADQRDRLQTGYDYMERLKYFKLRREMWPHRANIDFMMAGKKVEFDERFDLNKELDRLKAMVLPQVARDLLHGKGVSLPPTHGSIKPRKLPNLTCDYDYDIDVDDWLSEHANDLSHRDFSTAASSAPASTAQKVAKAKTCSDEHSSSSAFGISITSLPAIDDHVLDSTVSIKKVTLLDSMSQKLADLITATAGVSSLRRRTMRKRSALRKTVTLMAPSNDIPSSSDTDSSQDCILIDADTKHAKKGCPFVMELSDSEDECDSVKLTVEMAVSGVGPSAIDISDGGSDDASDVSKRHVLIDVSGGDSDGEGVEQENHGPGMSRLKVGQRPGIPRLVESQIPGMPRLVEGQIPVMPRLVEGHKPAITGLEEGQRTGMPRLEEGQRPGMPRLEEGQRHWIPWLEVRLTRIDEVVIELEDKVDHRERVCQKEDGEKNQPRHERTGVKVQGCITGENTGGARRVRGAQCFIDVDNNQLKRQRLGMKQKVCLLSGCAGGAIDVNRTKRSCTKKNNELLKHKACELNKRTACIVKDSRSNAISGCGRITRNRLSCNVCGKLLTSKFEQEQHRFMHIVDQAKSVDVIYVEPPSGMKILPCQMNNADPKLYFHNKCCTNICDRKDYLKKAGDRPKLQKMAGDGDKLQKMAGDRDKLQKMPGDRDKIQTMAGERDKLQMTYRDESQKKMGGSKMNVMRVKATVAKRDGGVRQDLQDLTSNGQCVNYIEKIYRTNSTLTKKAMEVKYTGVNFVTFTVAFTARLLIM